MQRLQTLELAPEVCQARVGLAKFVSEQTRQIGNGEKSEKIDENNRLQSTYSRMGNRKRRHHLKIRKLEHRSIQNESQGRSQIGPDTGQQDAGKKNDQRIQKIQFTVYAAGDVNEKCD